MMWNRVSKHLNRKSTEQLVAKLDRLENRHGSWSKGQLSILNITLSILRDRGFKDGKRP